MTGNNGKTATNVNGQKHNPREPVLHWFQEGDVGLVLFIVFYTQGCRWGKCIGCTLPSLCSAEHVDYRELMAQVDHIFSQPDVKARRKEVRQVIVSNNGSVLDEKTFSSTALIYFLAEVNIHLPNMEVLTIETRPEYVEVEEIDFISRTLKEGDTPTELEIAIGFEIYDSKLRNEVFLKGLYLDQLEALAEKLGRYQYRLKCYFMQKPVPRMADDQAIEDVVNGIDYLSRIAGQCGVKINMHLNPTYAARGTRLETAFLQGEFTPPTLTDVVKAVRHASGKGISLYVGLYDEGLAVPGGSFIREGDEPLVELLTQFNRTQDYSLLNCL